MVKKVKKNKIFMCIMVMFIGIILTLAWSGEAYASEEIYFDDEGNLIYITYDKKATSSVSYKAIGWILKRYDAPIDAKGQQYVIVRKIEYAVDDVNNPGYLYCYFWSDKNEILNAVGRVSAEWRRQLEKYGDTVYIDNVMTVCNNRVPFGNVDANGNCTGEVYYTLSGIQKARPWARPEFLKSYFDIKLPFPILYEEPEFSYTNISVTPGKRISSGFSAMEVGSQAPGEEKYDVSVAVPGGENIYFEGQCDSYHYALSYNTYLNRIYIPVKVNTNYTIKWKDIYGRAKSETKTVSRWYKVWKDIEYIAINDFKIYDLSMVTVDSDLLENSVTVCDGRTVSDASVVKRVYGDCKNHLVATSYICKTKDVVLTSNDFRKPSIPETDYSATAKNAVNNIYVRSDFLSVEGKNILSDTYSQGVGMSAVNITQSSVYVGRNRVPTISTALNGLHKDFVMNCDYVERSSRSKMSCKNEDINGVNIHTPVLCFGNAYGEKTLNQSENPSIRDVVVGGKFYINLNFFGTHIDEKGYGTGDYSKYVKEIYVKFEFDVIRAGELLAAGEWIRVDKTINEFKLADNVKLGKYRIEYKVIAVNGSLSSMTGDRYNGSIYEYGASGSSYVNVIGRMYDFKVISDEVYVAGNRDREGKEIALVDSMLLPKNFMDKEAEDIVLSLTTMGEVSDAARIEGKINYYYIGADSDRLVNVDLYTNSAYNKNPEKVRDSVIFEKKDMKDNGDNTYVWQSVYSIPKDFAVVKKGALVESGTDIKDELMRDGVVMVVFEFRYTNGTQEALLYVNEVNAGKGYCNMWKMQGGTEEIDINEMKVRIKDGTAFYIGVPAKTKYDFEVNGTH